MKVLVTGGAGFIGSNLVLQLVQQTENSVLNVDALTYAGNLDNLRALEGHPRYSFAHANICDAGAVKGLMRDFRPNWIMHLAAESHVDRSIDGPAEFVHTNILGTFTLLQEALAYFQELSSSEKESFRFLHVSTDEVYGTLGATGRFTEDTPYSPHSPYSASKASSDHLARSWHDTYGLPVIVTNCSNNYGPFQFPEKLIPVVILRALQGRPIPIYGKGENIRDWLHVQDHVEALCRVMQEGRIGSSYNIGGNNEMRNVDLVRSLCDTLDLLRPRTDGGKYSELMTFVKDRPGHDLRYAIDATKIGSELGWRPRYDRGSGLTATAKWYLENEQWWQRILNGSYRLERLGAPSGAT